MAWTDDTNPLCQQWDSDTQNVQFFQQSAPSQQQPTTILQQISPPPALPVRRGHVREDLVELMMIQNAQMHQVIMNNMTMSALSSFGYPPPSSAPEASRHPVIVHEEDEEEEDPMVYHHHYQPAPYLPYPAWAPLFNSPFPAPSHPTGTPGASPSSPLPTQEQEGGPPTSPSQCNQDRGSRHPPRYRVL